MKSLVSRHEQRSLAIELIRRKLRTSVVHLITGVPAAELRTLYREIHGHSPSPGLLPSTAYLFPNRRSQTLVSLFASIYRRIGGNDSLRSIDAYTLIKSYDLFQELTRPILEKDVGNGIDITGAWIIARDLRSGVASLRFCLRCQVDYLVAEGSDLPATCPFCAQRKQRRRGRKRGRDLPPSQGT